MANFLDPHLPPSLPYGAPASSLPASSSQQPYATAGLHPSGAVQQPYYLPPTPSQQPRPAPNALDPALEGPSPSDRDSSPETENGQNDNRRGSSDARSPGGTQAKRPRACDRCRGLKVKCDKPDPNLPCERCMKAAKKEPCVTTPPTRKRAKKADSRVAELERKVDLLTAELSHRNAGAQDAQGHSQLNSTYGMPPTHGNGQLPSPYSLHSPQGNGRASAYSQKTPDWGGPQTGHGLPSGPAPARKRKRLNDNSGAQTTIPEDMDAIHRDLTEAAASTTVHSIGKAGCKKEAPDRTYINGLIDRLMTPDTAERIFVRYVKEICPNFPAVPLPPGTTAKELRLKKTLLFLAILAGSCHGGTAALVSKEVQKELTELLKNEFANIIWRNGEKSLEIVQALQLGVLWYRPPVRFEQHSFYMMTNCAVVMALDLGLGRPTTQHAMSLGIRHNQPNANSIEARRAFLVCYYLSMSITMVLRRPILLRWTEFMEESVIALETSSEAYPSDRVLCHHVKLANIGQHVSIAFQMDNPCAQIDIANPEVIQDIKVFETELGTLRQKRPVDVGDPAVRLGEHVTNLYLHEIALHNHQSAALMAPPFHVKVFKGSEKQERMSAAHIDAICKCFHASHSILDTILSVPLNTLLTLPVIFCVRAIYAVVCLMKLWVIVSTADELSGIISHDDLRIPYYLVQLLKMFKDIVQADVQSPHGKFYFIASQLQNKFAEIQKNANDSQIAVPATDTTKISAPKLDLLSDMAAKRSTAAPQPQQSVPAYPQQPLQQIPQPLVPWQPPTVTLPPNLHDLQNPNMMSMGGGWQLDDFGVFDPNFDPSNLYFPEEPSWDFPADFGVGNSTFL